MRTGIWSKHRISLGQEFVVGGYTPGTHGLDALIVGFYEGKDLRYAARVRAGFVPATRREVFAKIKDLATANNAHSLTCPSSRVGVGIGYHSREDEECVWLKPEAVARIDFLEWTGLTICGTQSLLRWRDDKEPRKVVRETWTARH